MVAQVHAINTLLNSVKAIVVLLVWQITSPARPRTCLAKAKDLTFKAKDSKCVLEDISRPRQQHCQSNGRNQSVCSQCCQPDYWLLIVVNHYAFLVYMQASQICVKYLRPCASNIFIHIHNLCIFSFTVLHSSFLRRDHAVSACYVILWVVSICSILALITVKIGYWLSVMHYLLP